MLKMGDIRIDQHLLGLESAVIVKGIAVQPMGPDTVKVTYELPNSDPKSSLIDSSFSKPTESIGCF